MTDLDDRFEVYVFAPKRERIVQKWRVIQRQFVTLFSGNGIISLRALSVSLVPLWALSQLYLAGVRLRHWLYDRKILARQFAPLPVVSIGNLVAGGSGKTQVALMLAGQLASFIPIAILSRGYRSLAEHAQDPFLVDIRTQSVRHVGDEPWLLASRLIDHAVCVVVGKRRFKGALTAKKWGARLVILDDGMQHRALHRDFEIVVIDGQTAFGSFLPKGRLREDPARLKNADMIFFVGHPEASLVKDVSKYTQAPQVIARIISEGVFDLQGAALGSLEGIKVGVFCGIGNPARFVKTVQELGAQVVSTHFSPDHQIPSEQVLYAFASAAQKSGASFLICTEKDKVKLSYMEWPIPVAWIKANLQLVQNGETWLKLVNEMKLIAGTAP